MRPRFVLLTVLLCGSVALTGCIDTAGSNTTAVETTTIKAEPRDAATIATTTATTTTVSYRNCPYYLAVDSARDEEISQVNETITYRELPPGRQREFETALRNGSAKLGTDLPSTWEEPRIVRYQGDRYYTVAHVC